jgi:hypothetical protein
MYHIIETLFNYLIKKNIISISSFEESFFIYKKLDKKIKLTTEIIKLNYGNESPYESNQLNITSIFNNENLYLWFHKKDTKSKFLPLSLLLFRSLSTQYKNTICIFKGESNKILIIKNSQLIASFIKKNIHNRDIILMKKEYFIENVEFFNENEFKDGFKYLTYNDLLDILNIKIDFKKVINNFIVWSALPFLISSILLMVIIGSYNFYTQMDNEKLLKEYTLKKSFTQKMKDNVNKNEELNKIFTTLSNEFKYIDKATIISEILKISKDINISLEFIRVEDKNVNFVVVTTNEEKIPLLTTKLFGTTLFKDVKNISSQKLRKTLTKATMQATLKER